ncbi:MAG: hypothetical protein CVV24_12465 [Ignavibacteriae bacterium HGW-Ignavibacteriae-3]|nr:MAG: hypothetical protein CVV24_12465 [Ignavibacteriae bacterium HGW-Ignavibacteriae-3]
MNLTIITFAVVLINIPFGYWRANVKKFSLQWFLSVHIPVPFIIFLRIIGHIGFAFYTYIFLVAAFFTGQQLGSYLRKKNLSISSTVDDGTKTPEKTQGR